jgi:hypothetical protein
MIKGSYAYLVKHRITVKIIELLFVTYYLLSETKSSGTPLVIYFYYTHFLSYHQETLDYIFVVECVIINNNRCDFRNEILRETKKPLT